MSPAVLPQPDFLAAADPRLSAELFVIPLDERGLEQPSSVEDHPRRYVVYAPLRRAAFIANAEMVNFLADLQEDRHADAVAADPDDALTEFLRRLQMIDAGAEDRPIRTFTGDPEPTAVTLFLTTACNLRCTYCYASAGDTPVRSMPLDVARRGIDFVAANARRRGAPGIELAFHGGGEPTVNWRTMTAAMDYARAAATRPGEPPLTVSASTATNGVLNDQQIDWIIANLSGASISFDGLPEVNDKHRLTIAGGGSSQRIMHTLRRFDAAGFPYGLRVTVTADQIASLPQSVEFLCRTFAARRIQVEPAYQLGRWAEAPSAETEEFIAAYRKAQSRARAVGKEIFYSAARVGSLTNHFCGISQDLFALSPDGNVSGCYEAFSEQNPHAAKLFYGRPDDGSPGGYTFRLPVLNALREQSVDHRAFCEGCYARWSCAGDCYHKSLSVNGDAPFAGSDRCHITRQLTLDQILDKIEAAGGLFWHEAGNDKARSVGKEVLA